MSKYKWAANCCDHNHLKSLGQYRIIARHLATGISDLEHTRKFSKCFNTRAGPCTLPQIRPKDKVDGKFSLLAHQDDTYAATKTRFEKSKTAVGCCKLILKYLLTRVFALRWPRKSNNKLTERCVWCNIILDARACMWHDSLFNSYTN